MGKTILFAFLLLPCLAFAQFADCNSTGPLLEKQITTTLGAGLLRSTGSCVRGAVVNGGLEMIGATVSVVDGDTVGQVLRWTGTDWVPRLIIFPASTGGVDTVYNGLTDRDTAFVLGGPLVQHTRVHGQKAYDITWDDMRTVYIEAQRTSGVAFSSLTMGSTAAAGVDFAHYNEVNNSIQAVGAFNYSTGNVVKIQDAPDNGTYFQQYDAGGGLFQTDIRAANAVTSQTIRVNRDAMYLLYPPNADVSNEAAFLMLDTATYQVLRKSPADFAGLYGDDWGSATVIADSPLSGSGTSGSHLVVATAGAAQTGVVNTSAQTLAGLKTFSGGVIGQSTSTAAALNAVGVADAAYRVVTSNSTISETDNFVAIGTLSNNRTMDLPSCNSTRDGWEYRFLKTGPDIYLVTLDPNGSETFSDGTASKTMEGQFSSATCKCRWSGSAGTWFYQPVLAPANTVYVSGASSNQTLRYDGLTSTWAASSFLYNNGTTGVGVNTSSPARTLHVQGTARITGSDGTATGIMGRDADGDISGVSLNSRLEISGGALDIAQQSATSGQVLKWSGTAWTPASDAGATAANLTAASSKVAITGGTGAVLNAATVDVTEANLSLSSIGGTLGVGQITNGTTGSFLRSGASVPAWETAASLQGSLLLPSGTSGQTLRYGSAWTANSLLYNDGTNIGINTTSPAQKLDVNGEMSVNGVLFGKGPGTGTDNVRAGYNSFISNTTGYNNSAIGSISLSSNTTGYNNMAIGSSCLAGNTTGNQNLAIGTAAMYGNTTGFNNVGIGTYALVGNVTGAFNAAVGHSTAQSNTVGNYCTAIGAYALNSNTTGDANIGIGMNAGYYITTGSYNTVIGSFSNTDITTGSNNTIIGSNITGLTSSLSNNIILADGAGTQRIRVLSDGKTGIGTTTPLQTLHVAGTARITGSDGTATGLMGRDADGDVSAVGVSVGLEFSGGNIQVEMGSGLNVSGNAVAWGGTLTENTTVDFDTYDVYFTDMPTSTTEDEALVIDSGTGKLARGQIPITAIRAPGEATYLGANGATGELVVWQPEDILVEADPTAGNLEINLNTSMKQGLAYSLFGCCNLTYNIVLDGGTMKISGSYGTVSTYTLGAGEHLEVIRLSTDTFYVSKK